MPNSEVGWRTSSKRFPVSGLGLSVVGFPATPNLEPSKLKPNSGPGISNRRWFTVSGDAGKMQAREYGG